MEELEEKLLDTPATRAIAKYLRVQNFDIMITISGKKLLRVDIIHILCIIYLRIFHLRLFLSIISRFFPER